MRRWALVMSIRPPHGDTQNEQHDDLFELIPITAIATAQAENRIAEPPAVSRNQSRVAAGMREICRP